MQLIVYSAKKKKKKNTHIRTHTCLNLNLHNRSSRLAQASVWSDSYVILVIWSRGLPKNIFIMDDWNNYTSNAEKKFKVTTYKIIVKGEIKFSTKTCHVYSNKYDRAKSREQKFKKNKTTWQSPF